jgi:hypothetical protein
MSVVIVVDVHFWVIPPGPAEAFLGEGIQLSRMELRFLLIEEGLHLLVLVEEHDHIVRIRHGINEMNGSATCLFEGLPEVV